MWDCLRKQNGAAWKHRGGIGGCSGTGDRSCLDDLAAAMGGSSSAKQPIEAPDIAAADREANALARELGSSVLLMDDQQARRCAASHGVVTMGTLGLLEVAAERGFVSLPAALEKLRATSCFLSDELIKNALLRDEARRHTQARDV